MTRQASEDFERNLFESSPLPNTDRPNQHAHHDDSVPAWGDLESLEAFLQADDEGVLHPRASDHELWQSQFAASPPSEHDHQVKEDHHSPRKLLDLLDPTLFDDEPPSEYFHQTPNAMLPPGSASDHSRRNQKVSDVFGTGYFQAPTTLSQHLDTSTAGTITKTGEESQYSNLDSSQSHIDPSIQTGEPFLNHIRLDTRVRRLRPPQNTGASLERQAQITPHVPTLGHSAIDLQPGPLIIRNSEDHSIKPIPQENSSILKQSLPGQTRDQDTVVSPRSHRVVSSPAEPHPLDLPLSEFKEGLEPEAHWSSIESYLEQLIDFNLETETKSPIMNLPISREFENSPSSKRSDDFENLHTDKHTPSTSSGASADPASPLLREQARSLYTQEHMNEPQANHKISERIGAASIQTSAENEKLETTPSLPFKRGSDEWSHESQRKKQKNSIDLVDEPNEGFPKPSPRSKFQQNPKHSKALAMLIDNSYQKRKGAGELMTFTEAMPHTIYRMKPGTVAVKAFTFIEPACVPYMKQLKDFLLKNKEHLPASGGREAHQDVIAGRVEKLTYDFLENLMKLARYYEPNITLDEMENILTDGFDWILRLWEDTPLNEIQQVSRARASLRADMILGSNIPDTTLHYLGWKNATIGPINFTIHLLLQWMASEKKAWVFDLNKHRGSQPLKALEAECTTLFSPELHLTVGHVSSLNHAAIPILRGIIQESD